MNKFEKLISANGDSTLKRRASIISNESKMAQEDIVATIKRAINQEELKLMGLTDFAPTHTTSLQPGNFLLKVVLQNGHRIYRSVKKIFII